MYGSEVLAYLATKQQFLSDALTIEDKVEAAVLSKLGIRVSPNEKSACATRSAMRCRMWQEIRGYLMMLVLQSNTGLTANAFASFSCFREGMRKERVTCHYSVEVMGQLSLGTLISKIQRCAASG